MLVDMNAKVEFRIDQAEKDSYETARQADGRESVSSWLRWLARRRIALTARLKKASRVSR